MLREMTIFKTLFLVSVAVWVGGLLFFVAVATPAAFRSLQRETASKFLSSLFPSADRWFLFWSLTACLSLFLFFRGRHLDFPSLLLELPTGFAFLLTYYAAWILHPQIRELKRKMNLPEFKDSAHLTTIEWAFRRQHRLSVALSLMTLGLGLFVLALIPRFLR
ncbi:MAG: DUF4149 domain-containing protein [Candidatus Omnitrophica bacterium]|nr:DUF4149 domain-containing protein [Candidatus Omnitrophota bacterium]